MISVVLPTRGRPDWVKRMWTSARDTAVGEVEFCFYFDDDDLSRHTVDAQLECDASAVTGPRCVLSEAWNKAAEIATGDILMHAADDIIFRTAGWDEIITAEFERFDDRIAFVYGRDGYQDERLGTHGFLSREWVETVGYFVPPYFSSDYNDVWLHEVAGMIGRRIYVPEVLIEHMHPDAGKGELDQTHQERIARHLKDNPGSLYRDLLGERVADAERLRKLVAA